MRFFRLNSFTIIGLILVAIGAYGKIKGPSFQYDAGLPAEHLEWLYYIIVGVLMIVNGLILPRPVAETASADAADQAPAKAPTGQPVRTK